MSVTQTIKRYIAGSLSRRGYAIRRDRFPNAAPINVLDLLISRMGPERPDFQCLQIGANDGITNDPIREYFLQYQWQSVLVEPVPATFARLKTNYASASWVAFENCAIAAGDGQAKLYVVSPENADQSRRYDQLASFSKETLLEHGRDVPSFRQRVKAITVPALTMSTLVKRHRIAKLDVLQIDTEGFDYQIIRMTLAIGLLPNLIHFEHRHLSPTDGSKCYHQLAPLGYRFAVSEHDVLAYRGG